MCIFRNARDDRDLSGVGFGDRVQKRGQIFLRFQIANPADLSPRFDGTRFESRKRAQRFVRKNQIRGQVPILTSQRQAHFLQFFKQRLVKRRQIFCPRRPCSAPTSCRTRHPLRPAQRIIERALHGWLRPDPLG